MSGPVCVLYPRGFQSGGPEALHQLVDCLRTYGERAFLVPSKATASQERVASYESYDCPELSLDEVPHDAIVVGPETMMRDLFAVSAAKRYCWWLSIDKSPTFQAERSRFDLWTPAGNPAREAPIRRAKRIVKTARVWVRGDVRKLAGVSHLAQSEYARAFLYSRMNILSFELSDYTTFTPGDRKESGAIIAYNPAKSASLMGALKQRMPDITFLALENMDRAEISHALSRSTVYVDLGMHPGKDRMPREAALAGAVVVVARRGAGAFRADVPVPEWYKVSPGNDFLGRTDRTLRTVLGDPHKAFEEQAGFRQTVLGERANFFRQVEELFVEVVRQ